MLYVGIFEPLEHRLREFAVVVGVADCRQDLAEHSRLEERASCLVAHTFADRAQSVQVRSKHHRRMRAVQYAHLALLVRVDVVGPDHVDSGFLERQLIFEVALDHPQMENLGGVYQLVARAECRQLGALALLLRIAGADAVDERRAEAIFLFNPLAKAVA